MQLVFLPQPLRFAIDFFLAATGFAFFCLYHPAETACFCFVCFFSFAAAEGFLFFCCALFGFDLCSEAGGLGVDFPLLAGVGGGGSGGGGWRWGWSDGGGGYSGDWVRLGVRWEWWRSCGGFGGAQPW